MIYLFIEKEEQKKEREKEEREFSYSRVHSIKAYNCLPEPGISSVSAMWVPSIQVIQPSPASS